MNTKAIIILVAAIVATPIIQTHYQEYRAKRLTEQALVAASESLDRMAEALKPVKTQQSQRSFEEVVEEKNDLSEQLETELARSDGPPVAENGDVRGWDNDGDGRSEPVHVRGYYRKDGTYVRGHYRARPKRR